MHGGTYLVAALVAILTLGGGAAGAAPLKVVTTTQDLESIVREIGGDKVQVEALAKGYQDPHFVEAKPSFVLKLHAADLLVAVGRELESAWLRSLVTQARNSKIQPGADGYLDASLTARILELPTGEITRAMGDVHPMGNPHYWLSPGNGRRIAQAVEQKLSELDRADASYFAHRYADFDRRLTGAERRWKSDMAPYKGAKIVTYHRSWPNFAEEFGLDVIGYVEPKPGIPASPSHTFDLINEMKRQNVKIILVEPYFDLKTPQAVARATGATVLVLLPSVGGAKEVVDYIQLFDYNLKLLVSALRTIGSS
jgi:zinc/manganese transport system substrate-binding protein